MVVYILKVYFTLNIPIPFVKNFLFHLSDCFELSKPWGTSNLHLGLENDEKVTNSLNTESIKKVSSAYLLFLLEQSKLQRNANYIQRVVPG